MGLGASLATVIMFGAAFGNGQIALFWGHIGW